MCNELKSMFASAGMCTVVLTVVDQAFMFGSTQKMTKRQDEAAEDDPGDVADAAEHD